MNRILAVLAGGLLTGAFAAAYAELPLPTAQEKAAAAAKAQKAAAEKAGSTTQPAPRQGSAATPARSQPEGADHANSRPPDAELTRKEAQTEMPKPGQANDHSTTARDPQNSSGRH